MTAPEAAMRRRTDRTAALCLVVVGAAYLLAALSLPAGRGDGALGPAGFPVAVGIGVVLTGLALLAPRRRGAAAADLQADDEGGDAADADDVAGTDRSGRWAPYLWLAVVSGYVLLWSLLGTLVAATALVFGVATRARPERWRRHLVIAVGFALAVQLLFDTALGVELPGLDPLSVVGL